MIQTVADNIDDFISSPNGLTSTHSVALLITQHANKETDDSICTNLWSFPRVHKDKMSHPVVPDVAIQRYNGSQKHKMPEN